MNPYTYIRICTYHEFQKDGPLLLLHLYSASYSFCKKKLFFCKKLHLFQKKNASEALA